MTRRWDRRRRLLIGATTIVLLGAAVFVVRAAWPNDRARSVDASEALERYREATADATVADEPSSSSSAPPVDPPAALPPAGVYRYRTSGSESIDALGGTSHTYPAETTLTVTANGCGVRLRWDVLVERREEWRLCLGDDGIELPPLAASYHEFYGTGGWRRRPATARCSCCPPTNGRAHRWSGSAPSATTSGCPPGRCWSATR